MTKLMRVIELVASVGVVSIISDDLLRLPFNIPPDSSYILP
jgi:hypothetical protein